jgi:hypothetical protein
MVETMHNIVLQAIKLTIQKTQFILVSCDEVTTFHNQTWLFMHVYMVEQWKKVPILLNL